MPKKIDPQVKGRCERARGGQRDPAPGLVLRGETRPSQSLIDAFIDELRSERYAVEPIGRVLREQGGQIAARTYREWRRTTRLVAARAITDALITDQVRDLA